MINFNLDLAKRYLGPDFFDYTMASSLTPPHLKCILTAMRDYGIEFFSILQNSTEPEFDPSVLDQAQGFVALVGDDTCRSVGPDHFDQNALKGLVERSTYTSIISTGAIVGIYDMLSMIAGQRRTGSLIIETKPEHEAQWAEFIRALSPSMHLIISTPNPEIMGKYIWPEMVDLQNARKHL